jgi:phenylacetate-coenzyme A ligase PaaK-like adenylate-forming protein
MGIKSLVAKAAAHFIAKQVYKDQLEAVSIQQKLLRTLLIKAANTKFGIDHNFVKIKTYEDFKANVPVRDYEQIKDYIELIAEGKDDVLWPGKPQYFCKSSGTTSGTKYIPLTEVSIKEQINAARNSLLLYVHHTGKADFFNHKMIFLQGSPELDKHGVIDSGRLSGIVYHHVPAYLNKNRMPSYETNCIEDWEQKVAAIVDETSKENLSLISGIPPWVVMYFEKLLEKTGKKNIKQLFSNFSVFAYGGVNFEPYRSKIETLVGSKIDGIETYPASEGFIAYQDCNYGDQNKEGLLLNVNGGIFYEFIKADEIFSENPQRIYLAQVEVGVNYALILNTNAGLWGYNIGDTVKFISTEPYRIIVTGRIKHFISAFGEHVIGEEVEYALMETAKEMGVAITEFTVAPFVSNEKGLSYHEWFVEFENEPKDMEAFIEQTDKYLQQKNSYYFDLRDGGMLKKLELRKLKRGAFIEYMKSIGKLGGQNKVPRLSNDRKIAEKLEAFIVD